MRISANALDQYLRDYQSGGVEALKVLNFYQPNSELGRFQNTLAEYFRQAPPATLNEAWAKICELTEIARNSITHQSQYGVHPLFPNQRNSYVTLKH